MKIMQGENHFIRSSMQARYKLMKYSTAIEEDWCCSKVSKVLTTRIMHIPEVLTAKM
ncbi:unnamed protein product [Tenebrio molitor]|nr:unnamed protein product [Tenebrio molitor]